MNDWKQVKAMLMCGNGNLIGHGFRVGCYSWRFAQLLRLDEQIQFNILLAGWLHDIGKLYVPVGLLTKPSKLTEAEYAVVQRHAQYGEHAVVEMGMPHEVSSIVRGHHERIDGSGYPDGLLGDELSIGMQIVGVCDTVDTLLHGRCYRPKVTENECREMIKDHSFVFAPAIKECLDYNWDHILSESDIMVRERFGM